LSPAPGGSHNQFSIFKRQAEGDKQASLSEENVLLFFLSSSEPQLYHTHLFFLHQLLMIKLPFIGQTQLGVKLHHIKSIENIYRQINKATFQV